MELTHQQEARLRAVTHVYLGIECDRYGPSRTRYLLSAAQGFRSISQTEQARRCESAAHETTNHDMLALWAECEAEDASFYRFSRMVNRAEMLVHSFAARAQREYRKRRFNGSRYIRLCFAYQRAVRIHDRLMNLSPVRLP